MNFFSSDEYLNLAGDVYFPGRSRAVRTVSVQGKPLRLLEVDGRLVTELTFLDYHSPVSPPVDCPSVRARVPWVVREIVPAADCHVVPNEELDVSPFIDWRSVSSFDDYWAAIRCRPNVKEYERRQRRLADAFGAITFTPFDQGEDVLALCKAWKSRQLRLSGLSDFYADAANVQFFEALRERGLLFAATLRASGHLLSAWLGVVHDGVLSGWVFTHAPDPELKKYSLGQALLSHLLRYSYEQGHRELDFSVGASEYKSLYATHVRVLAPVGRQPLRRAVTLRARRLAKDALRRHPALFAKLKNTRDRKRAGSHGALPPPAYVLPELERTLAEQRAAAAAALAQAKATAVTATPAPAGLPSAHEVESVLVERLIARKNKNFAESDRLRDELAAKGICIKDQKDKATGEPITTWGPAGSPDISHVVRLPAETAVA